MVSGPAILLFGRLSFRSAPTISLRNGHEAGGPERSLLADGADVGGHCCVPSPDKKEARLCGLLLLICYALRSGSVFLASEWRLSL